VLLGLVGVRGSRVRLMDVNTGRLSGLKYDLVCCFKLAADMVVDGVKQFVYDVG
jgi:hypothetical protein